MEKFYNLFVENFVFKNIRIYYYTDTFCIVHDLFLLIYSKYVIKIYIYCYTDQVF